MGNTDKNRRYTKDVLLEEIKAYCAETGVSPTKLCEKAVKDFHLVEKLEAGKDCTSRKVDNLRWYMEDNRLNFNQQKEVEDERQEKR